MYCSNCGEKNNEGSKFCANCGNEIITNKPNNIKKSNSNKSTIGLILSIYGFFTCGICSIIGLVYSIQGLQNSKREGKKDVPAILGIIISSIPFLIIVLGVIITIATSKEIEVPDFSNLTKDEARSWCEKEDAACYFEEEYSDTVPKEGFINQSEDAGTRVRNYTDITIKYSKGPKPEKNSSKASTSNKESDSDNATKPKENNSSTIVETADEYKASCQHYDYKEIARQPDTFKGNRAYFRGKVIQVTEGFFDSNEIDLRVDVTEDEYGLWYDTIYVTYKYKKGENRLLEDDIINMYGTLEGTKSYTSVLGAQITIPMLKAKYIDLEQ